MTFDAISESRLKEVCPDIAQSWIQLRDKMWAEHEKQIRVTCGYRSVAQQWIEYGKGRVKGRNGVWTITDPRKVVSHAQGFQSFHVYGLALDSCFLGGDPFLSELKKSEQEFYWNEYGRLAKACNFEWGGDWRGAKNDRPHVQKSYGLSVRECQSLYEKNGIKGVWEKCAVINLCGRELL
jgi:hypothetical protein